MHQTLEKAQHCFITPGINGSISRDQESMLAHINSANTPTFRQFALLGLKANTMDWEPAFNLIPHVQEKVDWVTPDFPTILEHISH